MAKGYAMERWQGRKGSNVFYKISNSSNQQKQGVRERVYEVSNPKTSSQALQRMKVRAAQNFFNVLAPILNRAMQGVKYGGMTRNQFMKYALSMPSTPPVPKGSNVAIPGEYLLSKGSLPGFINDTEQNSRNTMIFNAPFYGDFELQSGSGINSEQLSRLTKNGLQIGDQITIILVTNTNFRYLSFELSEDVEIPYLGENGELLLIGSSRVLVINYNNIMASAVIVSRKNGSKYERSTAYMAMNTAEPNYQEAYSTEAINAALATYMKSVSVNGESADWPVEPESGEDSPVYTITDGYLLSGLTGTKQSLNGRKVLVYENANTGDLVAVATKGGYVVDYENHQVLTYLDGGIIRGLMPSDVAALVDVPTRELPSEA